MFINDEIAGLYAQRSNRYLTAMRGGTPDRIPIRFFLQEAAALIAGYTSQQVACDYGMAFECTRKAAETLGCDAVMLNAIWSNYGVGKAAGWKYLCVPGVDMTEGSVLQYKEPLGEDDAFLRESEYDELIDDPTAFLVNKWISRNSARIAPTGGAVTFNHTVALIAGSMAYANYMNAFGPAAMKLQYESGIVSANAGMIKAPFDILCDKFRGYVNAAVDTIERPETVRKACEALIPHIIANALGGADPAREAPITLWAHRGCLPFVSRETFDRIVWPTLLPVLEEIIAKGYQILFYAEGNWEAHYDVLNQLPAGGIIYHLDRGSPRKAAEKFKGRFALSGGLAYDVLARGTADDVRRHMKELFEVMKPNGGYILDATALMMNDIQPENLAAAVAYTMENGLYSQTIPAAPRAVTRTTNTIDAGKRPPDTMRPWTEESAEYAALSGDVDRVKKAWEAVDAAAYNYVWTSVLW
jgi:uroporphyrinogen-III decarboxylase